VEVSSEAGVPVFVSAQFQWKRAKEKQQRDSTIRKGKKVGQTTNATQRIKSRRKANMPATAREDINI